MSITVEQQSCQGRLS